MLGSRTDIFRVQRASRRNVVCAAYYRTAVAKQRDLTAVGVEPYEIFILFMIAAALREAIGKRGKIDGGRAGRHDLDGITAAEGRRGLFGICIKKFETP